MDAKKSEGLVGVKRGDRVVVVFYGYRRKDEQTVSQEEVVKAGPKYVSTAQHKFHRSTGREVTEYTVRRRAFASESEWLHEQHDQRIREDLRAALQELKVHCLPLAEAERILHALSSEAGP